jgi:uridine phosphorylase
MQREEYGQGIIRPVRGKRDPAVGPVALMIMLPHELKRLVRKAGATEVGFSDTPLYRLYRTEGPPIALTGPFIGAPHAVMGLEKLIVLGAKSIYVLGWCGSLQPDLDVGDWVIPNRAVSEEGTSPHYPVTESEPRPNQSLKRLLTETAVDRGLKFREGGIWTTDAIYRETREKVRRFQGVGLLAVEMEISALFTVAAYRCVALAGLLVVSDELADLKWRPGFSNPRLKEATQSAGDLLLHLSRTLAASDTAAPDSL